MHGTLIGTVGISEKQQRDRSLGSGPEIKRRAGGVGESESRFRQWRCDQPTTIRVAIALLRGQESRKVDVVLADIAGPTGTCRGGCRGCAGPSHRQGFT